MACVGAGRAGRLGYAWQMIGPVDARPADCVDSARDLLDPRAEALTVVATDREPSARAVYLEDRFN